MHNLFKRAFALVLCLMLVFTLPLTVQAEETEESQVIRILRTQQFLDLAENCILDRYSQDLTVVLLVVFAVLNVVVKTRKPVVD